MGRVVWPEGIRIVVTNLKNTGVRALATLAVPAVVGTAHADAARFGPLAPGALVVADTAEVSAEICRDHLFDPAAAPAPLPAGYRLVRAAEAASTNPALEALLRANAQLGSYALGTLCVMSVGRMVVDATPLPEAYPMPVAFWWAAVQGPVHADMRGKVNWVQLKSWYSARTTSRAAVRKMDPMAEFVDLGVDRVQPNQWRVSLALANETITAEVTTSGSRQPTRAAQPGYMSVPMSGAAAEYFSVFTYYGHHHQAAQGSWRATGRGVFTDAFALHGEAAVFGTAFQDGWASRSGLYRF